MTAYWIGVASRDHVLSGVKQGICQLGHGKEAPVRRLRLGDIIVYYSPKERLGDGALVQAFTAVGRIIDEQPYQVNVGNCFKPFRRNTAFITAREAPINPMLSELSFTRGRQNWGIIFRRGAFMISDDDYAVISHSMGLQQTTGFVTSPSTMCN